jgi:hypothetical protein
MENHITFSSEQIRTINKAVEMAEELVSNYFKMSEKQWLHPKYDIKTQADLTSDEIISGPFAQIIRYKGKRENTSLESASYDYYKICLQDYSILAVIQQSPKIKLFPFLLYIITHELIHIVRFSRFLQRFDALPEEKMAEESRVHQLTHDILKTKNIKNISEVMTFYQKWRTPIDGLTDPK